MNSGNRETALVTGASSGIGAIYADRLARRGHDLVLVARNADRLNALAARISAETGRRVETLVADLGRPDDLARVEHVLRTNDRLSMLINNAGVGATSPLLASDVEKMQELITLNISVVMRLAYAAIPAFVSRNAGTLVNVSSIVAISPETLNGVYGGSKAFVLAFSQSLQHELADKNVRVQAVLPGATRTDFWETAGLPLRQLPTDIVMAASDMVDAALAGLDQGELVTIPSLPDLHEWDAFDAARRAMATRLSSSVPARRYRARAEHGARA